MLADQYTPTSCNFVGTCVAVKNKWNGKDQKCRPWATPRRCFPAGALTFTIGVVEWKDVAAQLVVCT